MSRVAVLSRMAVISVARARHSTSARIVVTSRMTKTLSNSAPIRIALPPRYSVKERVMVPGGEPSMAKPTTTIQPMAASTPCVIT